MVKSTNEITVWVGFTCDDPNGKIGFSGVKLEDLTATELPKTPEQIAREEIDSELELLKWMEKRQNEGSPQESAGLPAARKGSR